MLDDFLEALKKSEGYEEKAGPIYYDSKTNRFLQLRGRHDDYLIFGDGSVYFDDAKTTRPTQPLSYRYVKGLTLVKCIDEIPGAFRNNIGWRVRKED